MVGRRPKKSKSNRSALLDGSDTNCTEAGPEAQLVADMEGRVLDAHRVTDTSAELDTNKDIEADMEQETTDNNDTPRSIKVEGFSKLGIPNASKQGRKVTQTLDRT